MRKHSPPNSKESEMMVLGCMLTQGSALSIGAEFLEVDNFYYDEHRTIFTALKESFSEDRPADLHLISEKLKQKKSLKSIGGISYLATLASYVGSSAYIEEYVEIVKKKYILRKMLEASKEIECISLKNPDDVYTSLDEAQNLLFKISHISTRKVGERLSEILHKNNFLENLEKNQELFMNKMQVPSHNLKTGFIDLDEILGGMGTGNLLILASRPSMGKTALSLNICQHIAFKEKKPLAFFSLEMTSEEIMHRLISSESEVEAQKIKNGSINGREYQKIVKAVKMMESSTFIIDDQPGMKITDLRSKARRIKEIYDIEFLVVDYLQLLSGSRGYFNENRQNEISEISRMLKNLAREIEIPILCLSQLSRKVEERTGHMPMLSDIRESGSIEQDADIVIFVYRADYYDENDRPGMANIIIGKNRNGRVGNVKAIFRKEYAQFHNYLPDNTIV